ncbi:hypothetical protein [Arthrobacter sp. Bz4]|uniref:hypothetical protein n=1 Tax=Arthrobacter sp. Bz4 TaxID=2171979 RepID=UPI0010572684|nr:hypothetical protein [Arthrobacter sp. Bz4]
MQESLLSPDRVGSSNAIKSVLRRGSEEADQHAGEIAMGLLIFSRGRSVKVGLAGAIAFLNADTPLGIWTLPNLVLAGGLAWLLKEEYPTSVWHSLRSPSHHKVIQGTVS